MGRIFFGLRVEASPAARAKRFELGVALLHTADPNLPINKQ